VRHNKGGKPFQSKLAPYEAEVKGLKADYSLFSRTLPGSVAESCEFWCASPAVLVRTKATNGAHHSIKWCAPKPRLVRTKHDLGALACLELPSQQRSSGEKTAVFSQKDRVLFPKRPCSFSQKTAVFFHGEDCRTTWRCSRAKTASVSRR
jgi:hypothetical protein